MDSNADSKTMTDGTEPKPTAPMDASHLAVLPDPSSPAAQAAASRRTFATLIDDCDRLLEMRITRHILPCLLTSALACSIVTCENLLGLRHRQWYLIFNLILAWIPLAWAFLVLRMSRQEKRNPFIYWSCAVLWLLFLPNAPYLFTDLVHLFGKSLPYYWADMMKILLFALAGMVAGLLSMRLMHNWVEDLFGRWVGWGFVGCVSVLCGIGVALGRFNRWNSWDFLRQPRSILHDAFDFSQSRYVTDPKGQFTLILAALIFCFYLTLFGFEGRRVGSQIPPDNLAE